MAVTTGYVGSAAITWSASTTATVTSQSIGTAAWDRIVIVAVTVEETATIDSCTIGGATANVGISGRNTTGTPDNAAAIFWLPVPTGTTANIVVTLSATSSQTGRISVWAARGAHAQGTSDTDTGQGSGTTQTITALTIPPQGAGFCVFNNATTNTAVTWTNATERDDTSVGNYRHSAADTTTAGTNTITADGATANQILSGIAFEDAIPRYAWKRAPTTDVKAVQSSARLAFVASVASGLIFTPTPPVEAEPFYAFDVTSGFAAKRVLNYQDLFHVARPIDPSPEQAEASVTTDAASSRTLHYQALVQPVVVSEAPNLTATLEWLIRWDKPPRYLLPLPGGQPFIPAEATRENTVTPDKWLQAWRGPPQYHPVSSQWTPFVPKEAVLENTVTPDNWLQRWEGPPRSVPAPLGGTPFVPKEAVLDNTVTPDSWLLPFQSAASPFRLNVSQVTFAPFAQAEDNTVTIDKWQLSWNLAAHAPKPIHTQPVYGFPYEGVDNTRTEWDWSVAWEGPPRLWPLGKPYQPFVPAEATVENTVTPDKWLQAWRGPPGYEPVKSEWTPFIPPAPAADNTVTPDNWLQSFRKAVDSPPPRRTQPLYAYPYETEVVATTTTLEWLQAWRGPQRLVPVHTQPVYPHQPRYEPPQVTASVTTGRVAQRTLYYQALISPLREIPFVPNTETIDKWQQPLSVAVPARPVWTGYAWRVEFPYEQPHCVPAFQADAFQNSAFQICPTGATYQQTIDAGLVLTVDIHVCGWGTTAEAGVAFVEQAEAGDPWAEQAQSDDDYEEQEECGR